MKQILYLLLSLLAFAVNAQIEESETAIFEVKFEKFKPSTQDQIRAFEGTKPMQFMAPDVTGEEQYLLNYLGKTVFIYFFNTDCEICEKQTAALNLIQDQKIGDLKVIAIGDESQHDLLLYKKERGINYTILYNGKMLGEAAYGIEMGYPRLFVVDEFGVIQHVLPAEAFEDPDRTYLKLSNLFDLVNSNE
ncbi:TlpA disulfide reductase family protein [Portibacter marinus]|uniref:TlpA disulfide reductase family protein n=1 Tax=Portibacter marinus TaxID=2898660 RepID=UPI001F34CE08|nr:TlpA disulfide reductase family protein [Portibacter marinus]